MQHKPSLPRALSTESSSAIQVPPVSELVRDFDWSTTPLGPSDQWPDSLRAVVRIVLTSGFPMWMAWGPELTMLYNDAYARTTLGRKHPSALGHPSAEVWPEIWADVAPLIKRVMDTGEACWEEGLLLILERNDYREESYHTFSYSPLAGPEGTIVGMLCVVIEDSERVIGERQLTSLSALAASLVGAIKEHEVFAGIERGLLSPHDIPFSLTYLFDDEGKQLNLVARTGFTGDHSAAPVSLDPEDKSSAWPLRRLLADGQPITLESPARQFPDLPRGVWDKAPARARLVPLIRPGQEKAIGVLIVGLNPYRQLDSSYSGFIDLLAGQIAASVSNAKAYEGERQRAEDLAELDRAKTAFFSNVSHELRTPLTLILGPIEDALTSGEAPDTPSLEMLHRNALRLLKLVNGLLDFVRIEVGRMRANYEAVDLSALTAQLASVFRSAIERAGLKLIVDCPPLPEKVYVDREMWEKIVLNLLSNALKSTFQGEINVAMRSTETGAELSISDTGTGISKDELPHLFQRFRRIDGARRRSHEGSGIGLALVQELAEMHGGLVTVDSTFGEGTAFTVSIPFGHKHLTHGHVVVEGENLVTPQGSAIAYVQEAMGWLPGRDPLRNEVTHGLTGDLSGITPTNSADAKPEILLVDDNADMRAYVTGLLGRRFNLTLVANGKLALDQLAVRVPALVLTDVMMPELDGFGFLKALRANPVTRTVPVIMLSARAGEESRMEGIDAGADDYLTKPFTARELVARVEAQIKLARVRREAVQHEASLTRELYQAKQFAWEALDHIPEVFYTFDKDYRFTYVNAAGMQISSQLGTKFLGEKLFDLLPHLRDTIVEASLHRAMEMHLPIDFDYYYAPLQRWFAYRVYPQPENGLAMYARDITEERKTEEALRKSEQLAAAGRLAASIAHEINNPLEAITNLLFLAKMDQTITGNTKDLLELADKELQRLSHIAARSLKFYRQRTAPSLTSLEELTDSVLFFHEADVRTRSITLERRYSPAPKILCHPGEIQQVVTNLIDNAIDALTRHGRLVIAVRAATDKTGRQGVALTIADTGIGMNQATLDRLFYPFITTKGEEGNGLGLWVSKGIVDKHQGTITVSSKLGCGTVFRLFLPVLSTIAEAQPN